MERCYRCMRGHIVNGVCNNCKRRPAIHTGSGSNKLVLQPGTALINGGITVGALLGKGGFGATYVADSAYDGVIALKEFLPGYMVSDARENNNLVVMPDKQEIFRKSLDAFVKEADLLSQLKHPNIVKVLFKFQANNTVYYGMELLEGTDLANFMKTRKGIPVTKAVAAEFIEKMFPVLNALDFLHRRNVYHRDISPANIFLRGWNKDRDKFNINFDPCLIDFGAAFVARDDYTKSVARVRNLYYSPYEQNLSMDSISPASDIYSLCATLYHALTGVPPQPAVDRMTDGDELKKPSEINPELKPLDDVLMHGLKVLPKDRTQHVRQLIQELEEAVKQLKGVVAPVPELKGPTPAPGPIPGHDSDLKNKDDHDDDYDHRFKTHLVSIQNKDSGGKSILALLLDIVIAFALAGSASLAVGTNSIAGLLAMALMVLFTMNLITLLAAKRSLGMLITRMPKRASAGKRVLAAFLRSLPPFAVIDVIISACGAYPYAISNGGAVEAAEEHLEDDSMLVPPVPPVPPQPPVPPKPPVPPVPPRPQVPPAPPKPQVPPQPPKRARYMLMANFNGPDGKPARFPLYGNTTYRIGRLETNDIVIPEDKRTVGRLHCEVTVKGDFVLLVDRSSNGCSLEGYRIDKNVEYKWKPGAKVKLADSVVLQLYENIHR